MANGGNIDELNIQIDANAQRAIRSIDRLTSSLLGVSNALNRLGRGASAISRLASSTDTLSKSLGNLSSVNLEKSIAQLDRLSRINLSSLKNANMKINVEISGASEAERMKYAIEEAVNGAKIDADAISKKLKDAFHLNKSDTESIRKELETIGESIAGRAASGQEDAAMSRIAETLQNSGRITKDALSELLYNMGDGLVNEYKEFLDYVYAHPINSNDIMHELGSGSMGQSWFASGLGKAASKTGAHVDEGYYEELLTRFPNVMSGFTADSTSMISDIMDAVSTARKTLEPLTGGELEKASKSAAAYLGIGGMQEAIENRINAAMKESATKIPLDVAVDSSRIETQIRTAINQATAKTYSAKAIKIDLDTQKIKDALSGVLSGVDVASLPTLNQEFATLNQTFSMLNGMQFDGTGIKALLSAVAKLGQADFSSFDPAKLTGISTFITEVSKVEGIEKSINQFIGAITRLSKTSDTMSSMTTILPWFSEALLGMVRDFQGIGSIDKTINQFITAISRFVSSGKEIPTVAQNLKVLSAAIKEFIEELSQSPNVSDNITNIVSSLGSIASSGNNIGRSIRGINSEVSQVGDNSKKVDVLKIAFDSLKTSLSNLASIGKRALSAIVDKFKELTSHTPQISSLTTNIKTLLGTLIGFRGISGIFNWAKDAVSTGSSIVELENVVDTAFGNLNKGYSDLSDAVYNFAQTSIDQFGVSEVAARKYAGVLMSMFNSSGFDQSDEMHRQAARMSLDLTGLAGDIASFYDISADDAFQKIQSGMAGMTRPLRSIGINMSVANLEAYALSQGITTAYQSMSQAEQQMLRYNYLMNATQYAQGDFQKTIGTYANQVRLLSLNFQVLSSTIGQGLISALRPAIAWLNTLMSALIKAAQAFRTFMYTLFGKIAPVPKGIVNDLADMSETMDDAGDSASGVGDGLGDAADSAKKLKKQLAVLPFDELNQLAKDTETASSGGSGSGGSGSGGLSGLGSGLLDVDDLTGGNAIPEAVSEWAQKIKDAFNDHNWEGLGKEIATGLNNGISKIYDILDPKKVSEKINPFIDAFTTTFNSLVDYLDFKGMGGIIGRGITDIVNAANRILDPKTGIDFVNLGTQLGNGFNQMVTDINWVGVGELISNKFMVGWNLFYGFVKQLDATNVGNAIRDAIGGAVSKIEPEKIGSSIGTFITKVATAIKIGFGNKEVWQDLGNKVAKGVNAFLSDLDAKELADAVNSVASAILTFFKTAIDGVNKDELKQKLADFFGNLNWKDIAYIAGGLAAPGFITNLVPALFSALLFRKSLKDVITHGVSDALKDSAASPEVETASTGMFAKLKSSAALAISAIKTGLTTLKDALIGGASGLAEGSLYGAIVLVAKKFAELQDTLRGGNGKLSEEGGILQSFINELTETYKVSGDVSDELFKMIQQLEDGEITSDEFGKKFSKALEDSGVSADDAKNAVDKLNGSMNVTDTQAAVLDKAISGITKTNKDGIAIWESYGLSGEDTFKKLKMAINNFDPDVLEHGNALRQVFVDTYNETSGNAIEAMQAVLTKMQEMGLEPSKLKKAIDDELGEGTYDTIIQATTEAEKSVSDSFGTMQKGAKDTATEVSNTAKSMGTDSASMRKEMNELHTTSRTSSQGVENSFSGVNTASGTMKNTVASNISNATQTVANKAREMVDELDKTGTAAETNGKDIPTKLNAGIILNAFLATAAVRMMTKSMKDTFNEFSITDMTKKFFSNYREAKDDAFDAGEALASALARGFKSVHIPVPSIDYAGETMHQVSTADSTITYYIPYYKVNWYAKGGLFTKPSLVAGFGEAGDEAALPLTNRSVMKRIGGAIADNMGKGAGLNEEQIANAVTRGVVTAMMNNSSQRDQTFNITVMTPDNEVLARSVLRGLDSMDYRRNATPSLSY